MRKFLLCLLVLLVLSGCASPIVKFDGDIRKPIIQAIDNSTETINIAMYRFTDKEVINALREVRDKVAVRVILGFKLDRNLFTGFNDQELRFLGGRKKGKGALMHHKFCIFDKRLVMTGSYNISANAHNNSYENAIFLSHYAVIREYQGRFDDLWNSLDTPH